MYVSYIVFLRPPSERHTPSPFGARSIAISAISDRCGTLGLAAYPAARAYGFAHDAATRNDQRYKLICIPSSTTLSAGIPKYWVADRAFREMKEKRVFLQRNIVLSPEVSKVSRPKK
jgi:hypothetical protein